MALRNIKITRDIVQTCNKTRAFTKPDLSTLSPQKQAECPENASKFHSVTYTVKSECSYPNNILPEVNATEKNGNTTSFMKLIKGSQLSTCTPNSTTSKVNSNKLNTLPRLTTTRSYSDKNEKKGSGCVEKEKKCYKNLPCPRFVIDNCPPAKAQKSECERAYVDPCCTKKMAPYPSYSELCAYRLEDHPSECKQCPWQRCGGVDDIKPQKKGYHTSTRSMNMAMIPSKSPNVAPFFLHKQCDASKEPCKEPPPKCKEREPVKEKCPEKKPKEKKKCIGGDSPSEAWTISGSIRNLDLQRYKFSMTKIDLLKAEIGVPSNLAEKIVYEMKDCPKPTPDCPPKKWKPPVVDHTMDERYRPEDPCCETVKRGQQPRRRPKVFVPEPRKY